VQNQARQKLQRRPGSLADLDNGPLGRDLGPGPKRQDTHPFATDGGKSFIKPIGTQDCRKSSIRNSALQANFQPLREPPIVHDGPGACDIGRAIILVMEGWIAEHVGVIPLQVRGQSENVCSNEPGAEMVGDGIGLSQDGQGRVDLNPGNLDVRNPGQKA